MASLLSSLVLLPEELPEGFWDLAIPQVSEPQSLPRDPPAHLTVTEASWPALAAVGVSGHVHILGVASLGDHYRLWLVNVPNPPPAPEEEP